MHSGVCASPLEHAKAVRVCLSAARHLCYTNDPPAPRMCLCRLYPQVWLARGSCGARYSGLRGLNRPGMVSERGPSICMEREERFTSPSARPPGASEVRGEVWGGVVLDQPPCRRNQVLSVPLQTLPSISPVPFPLPGPPPGGPVMHRRRWQAAEISAEQPAINIASDWLTCEGRGDYLTMSAVAGHRDWRRYFWLHCCHFSAGSFELIVKKLEHRCQSRNSRWEVRWEGGLTLMSIISIQTLVWLSDRYKWDCIDTCCYSVQDNHGQANSASFTFTLHCVLANQRKCKEVYFSVSSIKTHWLFVSLKHYGPDTVCPILFRLKLFLYNAQIHSTL